MYKGWLPCFKEFCPRICMLKLEPGRPFDWVTISPGTLPASVPSRLLTGCLLISCLDTLLILPVLNLRVVLPYPLTIVSSSTLTFGTSSTLINDLLFMGTTALLYPIQEMLMVSFSLSLSNLNLPSSSVTVAVLDGFAVTDAPTTGSFLSFVTRPVTSI